LGLGGEIAALQDLKKDLDFSLRPAGYIPEDRPFHPHLTLGPVTNFDKGDHRSFARLISSNVEFEPWQIHSIELMQSTLGREGSTYSMLASWKLGP
jgi:2'-5' RNA ligase